MSPGGIMLNAVRSRPELPPSSDVATIATRRSRVASVATPSGKMSGRSPRRTFGRPVPPPIATTRGDGPERGSGLKTAGAGTDSGSIGSLASLDFRKHVFNRAPIVLREIDLDPRIAGGSDDAERASLRMFMERPRGPLARVATRYETIHDRHEIRRRRRPELHDAEVFAVCLRGIH